MLNLVSHAIKDSLVALGTPGFSDWKGSVIIYNIAKPNEGASIFYYGSDGIAYIGYSVTFGKFFSDMEIAAGAPRSLDTGCKCGEQFGEYYGASVLAVDINNDNYDDLIVGAPFYSPIKSQRGDSGRIFVYMSRGSKFDQADMISIDRNPGARFGSAISNVGDLNYDGYNVGAPYEDNGKGAVYIYHGRRDGLVKHYSQRISASTHLHTFNLKGFGSSLSPGSDVDGNNYPDLLVGSYLSETAILLRFVYILTTVSSSHYAVQTSQTL
ncbi:hypothetical protein B4U80_00296 [Leptotrombidium deliense]|uniref:Uncharacterized protein n=1 Tax=Leptotrombidium deliense TaxID=299467 RepID=A0A443S2F7_9ACAR|nr:hypothetical protein B4U80_00296 [Leptotrombidium deliense]